MQRDFVVKVSDLLKNPGQTDIIEFEWISTSKIKGLTELGISGTVQLQSVNDETVLVTLEDISCEVSETSDISGKKYIREVYQETFNTKFVRAFTNENDNQREVFDEEFPIDSKNETIDLEDAVVQAIMLQNPIVKVAPGEEVEWDDDEMYYYDFEDEGHIGGKVTFS